MSRTEQHLHDFYNTLPTDHAAHRRLLTWIGDQPRQEPAPHTRALPRGRGRLVAASGVVCALAAGTTLLSTHLHGPRKSPAAQLGTNVSLPAVHRSRAVSTPASPPSASTATPAQHLTPVSPQVAVHTLITLLPRPVTSSQLAGRQRSDFAGGEVVVNDAHGASQMLIALTWPDPSRPGTETTGCGQPSPTCTTLANGTHIGSFQDYEYPSGRPRGAMEWSVTAYRKDKLQITVSEFNAPAAKDAKTTRRNPPFTIAELTTIATNPIWQHRVPTAQVKRYTKLFTPDPTRTRPTTR